MASYIPPTADLSTFNPAIFNQGDSEGITLQEADTRYLKKSGGFLTGGLGVPSISLDGEDLTGLLGNKQDTLSTGDGIDITNNQISFDGSISQDITTSASNSITAGTLNYINGGVVTSVQTEIENKQDTIQDGDLTIAKISGLQTAIGLKQDVLSASNKLSPNFITAEDAIEDTVTITDAEFGALNGFNATAGSIQTQLSAKQDTLTTGDGIDITGTVIKFDGSDLDQDIDVGSAYEIKGGTMYYYGVTGGTIRQVNIQTKIEANETAIGLKQDVLSASNKLSPNFITAEDAIEDAVTITEAEFGALNGFNATAGSIQTQLSAKQDTISSGTPLQIEVASNEVSAILATAAGSSNFGLIAGNVLNTELSSKQDSFTVTDGIQINSNVLSLTGDYSGSFSIGGTDFQMWNDTRGGTGTSNGRVAVHHYIGTAGSKATSVLRINYDSDFGAGTRIDSITGIKTNPDSSYDLKVNGNTDIGGTLSIDGYSNVKTALDAAGGGLVYGALANGGLAVAANGSGVNEFSIDLTNTNADFEIPQNVHIEVNGTPQLLVEPADTTSQNAEIEIRGARNGSTTSPNAILRFANYDSDTADVNNLGRIEGRVSNHTTNIGGMIFSNYADGASRTGQLTLSAAGNFNMGSGDTFQDDYKMKVTGSVNLNGLNYIKPQIRFLTYDKDNIAGANWGSGSVQTTVLANRTVGDSFCSVAGGETTLTKSGYYRIRVSAQTQSDGYNDRLGFMNYLRTVWEGTTTNYDFSEYKNFFGWGYIRNNTDGGHQSVSFEDYIYLNNTTVISVRHKCETGGTISFNNNVSASSLDNYLSLQIERVYDTNPE